jgi:low affinity Fe/Cu permease
MPGAGLFSRLANHFAQLSGKPSAFCVAIISLLVWLVSGPIFGFSDTWQLIMNSWTNGITFLMVFLIQNSQNRDAVALQIKLDELLHTTTGPRDSIVGIEHLTQDQLDELRQKIEVRIAASHRN